MDPLTAFGTTALEPPAAAQLGTQLEALGYDELWVNDTPGGDGLRTLAAIAPGAASLSFGIGVVALSEQSPAVIAQRARSAAIPSQRLTLGVGSGSSRSLELVRAGIAELRQLLPGQRLAMAAVGPRMARLAGEIADAVIANWALPDRLAELREQIAEGADDAGRAAPRLVAYVRTAVGPGAESRVRIEMERYARVGAHYARAFAEQGGEPVGVAVESADRSAVAEALAPYRNVTDTVVVRGLPDTDSVASWLEVARAAA